MLINDINNLGKRRVTGITLAVLLSCHANASFAFSLDDVAAQAKGLAAKSYSSPKSNLPSQLRELKYQAYHQIQFKHARAYWGKQGLPFRLEFYHEGMYFDTPVKINEITLDRVLPIVYSRYYFDFGDLKIDENTSKTLGFAGFKVLYPINNRKKQDEIASFLGASYFRVIGAGQNFGLSARGLAIDTALASGEEFPHFTEFWIERPKSNDHFLTIYALLDSPRATGAYRFILRPGKDTVVDVQARVFLRSAVGKLGVAPLTSMYLFGANQPSPIVNYRKELHDSEGLSIHNGNGEWIWRPLNNPRRLAVSTFQLQSPKGFGLLQRNRHFDDYQDLDDRYDRRPSAWIEPKGNWGKGQVELVEIPTNDETNDNVVAFWTPEQQPEPRKAAAFEYRIRFTRNESELHSPGIAWVDNTLRSTGDLKLSNLVRQQDGSIAFLIDFTGQAMSKLPQNTLMTPAVSSGDNADLLEKSLRYNPVLKGWRLTVRVKVKDPKKTTELRAALMSKGKPLTETWSYQLPANE